MKRLNQKSKERLAREAWRLHKQTKRDKAKRQYIWGRCWGDGPQPWFKRQANKGVRRLQKKLIQEGCERYDMHTFKGYLKEWWT